MGPLWLGAKESKKNITTIFRSPPRPGPKQTLCKLVGRSVTLGQALEQPSARQVRPYGPLHNVAFWSGLASVQPPQPPASQGAGRLHSGRSSATAVRYCLQQQVRPSGASPPLGYSVGPASQGPQNRNKYRPTPPSASHPAGRVPWGWVKIQIGMVRAPGIISTYNVINLYANYRVNTVRRTVYVNIFLLDFRQTFYYIIDTPKEPRLTTETPLLTRRGWVRLFSHPCLKCST